MTPGTLPRCNGETEASERGHGARCEDRDTASPIEAGSGAYQIGHQNLTACPGAANKVLPMMP